MIKPLDKFLYKELVQQVNAGNGSYYVRYQINEENTRVLGYTPPPRPKRKKT